MYIKKLSDFFENRLRYRTLILVNRCSGRRSSFIIEDRSKKTRLCKSVLLYTNKEHNYKCNHREKSWIILHVVRDRPALTYFPLKYNCHWVNLFVIIKVILVKSMFSKPKLNHTSSKLQIQLYQLTVHCYLKKKTGMIQVCINEDLLKTMQVCDRDQNDEPLTV